MSGIGNPFSVAAGGRRAMAALLLALPLLVAAQQDLTSAQRQAAIDELPWQVGPATGTVGERATLAVPVGMRLLPEAHGGRFLQLTGNLPEQGQTVLIGRNWWAVLSFNDIGYVKDDEKLDPDALLRTLKENDAPSNEERRKLRLTPLVTEGWAVLPHYDSETKRLEWGLRLRAEGSSKSNINYTVRVLSRSGYENVVLVTDADTLQNDVAELKALLKGFNFNTGSRYAEFRPGDRVAEIGLSALLLGGATAAAVKSGWFKGLLAALVAGWKFVAAAVVAGLAAIGKLLGRKKAG